MISILMLKMHGDTILEPFYKAFKMFFQYWTFQKEPKKANIIQIFKIADKRTKKNYHLKPVLPICKEMYEEMCTLA